MGRREVKYCDACHREGDPHAGYTLTIGFSMGGWGYRQDAYNWRGEVCEACFQRLQQIEVAARAQIESIRHEVPKAQWVQPPWTWRLRQAWEAMKRW